MKFSIITVCYNAKNHIEKTIKSVVGQDFADYEYIIVDGGSTDGTCEIIEKYAKAADSGDNKGLAIRYISEKDEGLYDAMNKGFSMAAGDYIEFLNAGDELFDSQTLTTVSGIIDSVCKTAGTGDCAGKRDSSESMYIFYGNIVYKNSDGSEDVRLYGKSCGKPIYFATGDCVNHQAIFAQRGALVQKSEHEKPFRFGEFSICADRDWMMRATKLGAIWAPLNATVVKYDLAEESISVRDKALLRAEERKCLKKNYPVMLPIYVMFDFCRNNKTLSKLLHKIYEILYIR